MQAPPKQESWVPAMRMTRYLNVIKACTDPEAKRGCDIPHTTNIEGT